MMQNKWTEPEIAQLKAMLAQGLFYREISQTLNRTKNAIAGVVGRLGISPNRQAGRIPKPIPMAVMPPKMDKAVVCSTSYRQGGEVPLIALERGMCKWPMFDRAGFCGAECGDRYCNEHEKVSRGRG